MPESIQPKLLKLDHAEIDDDHEAFIRLLTDIEQLTDADFKLRFEQILEHLKSHFERENELMSRYGFPAIDEHRGEHHRVLGECRQFQQRLDRGLVPFVRAFVTERMVPWFELHVPTMDSALTTFLRQKDTEKEKVEMLL